MRKYSALGGCALAALLSCGLLGAAPFRAAYYNTSWNSPTIQGINWPAWTQIYQFNAYPRNTNGTITLDTSEIVNPDLLISTAHSHGVRVLLTVFGTSDFIATTDTSAHVNAVVSLIANFIQAHNYDGVDIDWEGNVPQSSYTSLITGLRAQLDTYTPVLGRSSDGKAIISGFFGPVGVAAANIANIDIVNLSCYDNHSWDTSRWTVWHDAALQDPGDNGWSGGGYSCAGLVAGAVSIGIPASKIGAAMPFYIRDWVGGVDASGEGAQRPGQPMKTAPTMSSLQSLNQLYNTPSLWQTQYMHRDVSAGNVPYLSVNQAGSGNDHFVSYPDALSVTNAWNLIATGYQGVPLGGFTAYTMAHEYIPSGSSIAQQFPLSEALRIAAGGSSSVSPPSGSAPVITSTSPLPTAAPKVAYSQTLLATGSTPMTWSVLSGSLPSGLSLNATTGVISGTPTTGGTSTFTVRATNSVQSADKVFAIAVVYDPYTWWKLDDGSGAAATDASGNGKNAGLANNPAWLSGASCIAGGCLFFNGAGQYGAATLDLSDTSAITVSFWMNWTGYANDDRLAMEFGSNFNGITTGFMVDPNSSSGGGGQFEVGLLGDAGYNQVLFPRPTGGWHHYAFVFNKGAAGASEVTPYVDGVAVAYTKPQSADNTNAFGADTLFLMSRAGSSLFGPGALDDVRVSKRALSPSEITGLAQRPSPPVITSAPTLPAAMAGVAYVDTLTATGAGTITWSMTSGSLPAGLSLSTAGVISGMPSIAGVYGFTVRAGNGTAPDATQSVGLTVNVPPTPPQITTGGILPSGTVGVAYNQNLLATGTGTITWSVASGNLPAGLSLSAAGAISGTPSTAGTYSFTVRATNGVPPDVAANMSLTIGAPVGAPYSLWRFNDGAGAIASDSSGNGRNAQLFNAPVWQSGGSCVLSGCLSFNGSNQYGSVALDLSDTAVVTVAFWLYWGNYANDDRLAMEFSTNFNNGTTGFMIDPNSSASGGGKFEAGILGNAGYNQILFARPSAGWHHYAFVLNKGVAAAGQVTAFVDGAAVAYTKSTSSANTNNFGSANLYFMSRGGASLFGAGVLDDVRIYKRALGVAEVQGLAGRTIQ